MWSVAANVNLEECRRRATHATQFQLCWTPRVIRLSTLRRLNAFDENAGWAFEHDLYLRLVEAGASFRHVPAVLVAGRPPKAFEAEHISDDSIKVVEASLKRRGIRGSVKAGALATTVEWRVEPPSPPPSIDIVIPTRDRVNLVRQCIDAIERKTTYENYDIVIS